MAEKVIEIGKGIVSIEIDTRKGTLSLNQLEEKTKSSLQKIENTAKGTAEKTDSSFKSMANSIKNAYNTIASNIIVQFGTKIIKAFSDIQLKAIEFADEIDKGSKRIQMSAIAYQQYSVMAKMSGIETENFRMAMNRLSLLMFEAYKGNEEVIKIFKMLNIDILNANGSLKSLDDILPKIADKISQMENPTVKLALATELFGRSGNLLLPMLEGGGKALEETRKKISQLGLTIDDNMVSSLINVGDKLTLLSQQLEIAKVKATGTSEPLALIGKNIMLWLYSSLEKVNNAMQKFFGFWLDIWGKIAGTKIYNIIDRMFGVSSENTKNVQQVLNTFAKTKEKIEKQSQIDETKTLELFKKQNADIEKQKELLAQKERALKEIANIWADIDNIIEETKRKYNIQLSSQEEIRTNIFKIINTSKDWNTALEEIQQLLKNIKEEANIKINIETNIEKEGSNIEDIKKIYEEKWKKEPEIKIELPVQIELTPELIKLDKEQFKEKMMEYANIAQEISGVASEFGNAFSAMAEAGMINQREQLKYQKAMLIIQMMMDAYAGIARAVAQGGAYGFLIGLATFAKILAYIAKIKSMEIPEAPKVKYPKMAEGGIITKHSIVEVVENNNPEAIIPLNKMADIIGKGKEVTIKLDVSDKASFLRGLTAQVDKIKRKDYV